MKLFIKKNYKIFIYSIIFIFFGILLAGNSFSSEKNFFLNGILSSLQLLISVHLTISYGKKGYKTTIFLNTILFFSALSGFMFQKNTGALPGLINPAIAIIITTFIHNTLKELKFKTGRLNELAYYDYLTGLPNRQVILDTLQQMTSLKGTLHKDFTVIFADLDNFSNINDSLGHDAGDVLLQDISRRWKRHIKGENIVGRWGGDEFVFILKNITFDNFHIISILDKLQKELEKPFIYKSQKLYLTSSFGAATFPHDAQNGEDLLKYADIAMYKAKSNNKNNYVFFNSKMEAELLEQSALENNLKGALMNNEFYLVFQPILDCKKKNIRGFEVLARWNSTELGEISPEIFIPLAEKNNLINDLGSWIITEALLKFKKFKESSRDKLILSINISLHQFMDPNFVPFLKNTFEELNVDSSDIELEITESVFVVSPDHVNKVLNKIKKMGISISLDDFGTGYSSLVSLQNLPIDILKLDREFIKNITKDNKISFIDEIISIAHKLGISTIAEGIETEYQVNFLHNYNCDFGQGFYFSKPLIFEEALEYIEKYKKTGSLL